MKTPPPEFCLDGPRFRENLKEDYHKFDQNELSRNRRNLYLFGPILGAFGALGTVAAVVCSGSMIGSLVGRVSLPNGKLDQLLTIMVSVKAAVGCLFMLSKLASYKNFTQEDTEERVKTFIYNFKLGQKNQDFRFDELEKHGYISKTLKEFLELGSLKVKKLERLKDLELDRSLKERARYSNAKDQANDLGLKQYCDSQIIKERENFQEKLREHMSSIDEWKEKWNAVKEYLVSNEIERIRNMKTFRFNVINNHGTIICDLILPQSAASSRSL